jgi:hypothetical protein
VSGVASGVSLETTSNRLQSERSAQLRPPLRGGAAKRGVSPTLANHGWQYRVTCGVSNGDVVKWLADASSPAQTAGGRQNQIKDQSG